MSMAYNYSDNNTIRIRNHYIDVWLDLLLYAHNLNGNWHVSKDIFEEKIVPTAEKNPDLFADWINDMVQVSGIKIKQPSTFIKSTNSLKKLKTRDKADKSNVKKALTELINSGLDEPDYAQNAINKVIQKT